MASITVNSVTTGDATPTTAPHSISDKAGHNVATVRFTLNAGTTFRAWRVMVGGAGRTSGRVAGERGWVTGIARCGFSMRPTAIAPGTQIVEDVTFTEASDGSADGNRTVNIYAWADEGVA